MRCAVVLVIAGATFLGGCQAPTSFDPEDPKAIAEIEAQLRSMMAGAAAVDAGRVLGVAAEKGEVTFITGDVMLSGLETIRARFQDTYAGLAKQDQTSREGRVRLLSPDVALVASVGEGSYTDKAGWTSEPVGMGMTIVFVRENGVWRACHAHQSIAP